MPSGQGWVINWQAYLPHDVATQLSRWERRCLAGC